MFTKTYLETEGDSIFMLLWKFSRFCGTLWNLTAQLGNILLCVTILKNANYYILLVLPKCSVKTKARARYEHIQAFEGNGGCVLWFQRVIWKLSGARCLALQLYLVWLFFVDCLNTDVGFIITLVSVEFLLGDFWNIFCIAKPGISWVDSLFLKKYRKFLLSEWWEITI